jgi:hypothetical protein
MIYVWFRRRTNVQKSPPVASWVQPSQCANEPTGTEDWQAAQASWQHGQPAPQQNSWAEVEAATGGWGGAQPTQENANWGTLGMAPVVGDATINVQQADPQALAGAADTMEAAGATDGAAKAEARQPEAASGSGPPAVAGEASSRADLSSKDTKVVQDKTMVPAASSAPAEDIPPPPARAPPKWEPEGQPPATGTGQGAIQ